jgi:hypothetical protein
MVLAMLALWPMSLSNVQEYAFMTLAGLLVILIQSNNCLGVRNDNLAINSRVDIHWAVQPDCVFF